MLFSYTIVDFYFFYDVAVDIPIWALLTRSQEAFYDVCVHVNNHTTKKVVHLMCARLKICQLKTWLSYNFIWMYLSFIIEVSQNLRILIFSPKMCLKPFKYNLFNPKVPHFLIICRCLFATSWLLYLHWWVGGLVKMESWKEV